MKHWDEGLDEVPWENLKHAYGDACDVPDLLRGLTSSDGDVRKESIYELYGNIWHQGTIYDATSHAVPFLIRLHAIPKLPAHNDVATLLMLVGAGRGFYEVHSTSGCLPQNGTTLEDILAAEERNREELRRALIPILSDLAAYRFSSDRNLREVSLALIEANRDYFEDAFTMIEAALKEESDETILEQMTEILEYWDEQTTEASRTRRGCQA